MSEELAEVQQYDYIDVTVKGRVKAVANGIAHVQIEQQTLNVAVKAPVSPAEEVVSNE
jgi:hypothetical protein